MFIIWILRVDALKFTTDRWPDRWPDRYGSAGSVGRPDITVIACSARLTLSYAKTRRNVTYPYTELFLQRIIDWHWRRPSSGIHLPPHPLTTQSISHGRQRPRSINAAPCISIARDVPALRLDELPRTNLDVDHRFADDGGRNPQGGKAHKTDSSHLRVGTPIPVRCLQKKTAISLCSMR